MTTIKNKFNVYNGLHGRSLEDDTDTNELLKEILETYGICNFEFYEDTDLFLQSMSDKIHLCLIDGRIKNSIMQGVEAAAIIKDKYKLCQIIFVTGTNDPEELKKIIRLRPDDFVHKDEPNYLDRVFDAVKRRVSIIRSNMEFANVTEKYLNEQL